MPDRQPSRYRIIERDRQLVVIDQWSDDQTRTAKPLTPMRSWAGRFAGLQQMKFDGSAEWVTHTLYDLKAPRTIRLDPVSALLISRVRVGLLVGVVLYGVAAIWLPWLMVAIPILVQPGPQKKIRAQTTGWIDRLAQRQP